MTDQSEDRPHRHVNGPEHRHVMRSTGHAHTALGDAFEGADGVVIWVEDEGRSAERDDFLASVIVTAVEGGIGYWSSTATYRWGFPGEGTSRETAGEVTRAYAYAVLHDEEGDEPETQWLLGPERVDRALTRLREGSVPGLAEGNRALVCGADAVNDGGLVDAEMADWIVQVALFGEVRYG